MYVCVKVFENKVGLLKKIFGLMKDQVSSVVRICNEEHCDLACTVHPVQFGQSNLRRHHVVVMGEMRNVCSFWY
jgi:hypothetical protein